MKNTPERWGPVLGLDVGHRRIGVAISDELGIIATPTDTLHIPIAATSELIVQRIATAVRQRGATRVVVGLPRNMKGERGVQAEWTEEIAQALRQLLRPEHIPVAVYDERLTSIAAQRAMGEERGSGRPRRGKEQDGAHSLDARAATLILQGYLDRRRARLDERENEP